FATRAARGGFAPSALCCGYGLAEATSAVTMARPGAGLRVEVVDRATLERDGRAVIGHTGAARRLASVGRPLPGVEVRIVAANGACSDGEVGQIEVTGPTVAAGYIDDDAAWQATLVDGWLQTGDLGYWRDGDLIVTGRSKDVIILGGRNIAPEDVERAAT